jgi:N-acetylmuramoyl-L-alanine amidase
MDNNSQKRREFIFKLVKALGFVTVLIGPKLLAKDSNTSPQNLLSIQIEPSKNPNKQRLIFEFDGRIKHSIFSLHTPERIVLDLKNTQLKTRLRQATDKNSLINGIRHAIRKNHDLRIVLDLAQKVKATTKLLKTSKGYRLEVTLGGKTSPKEVTSKEAQHPKPKKIIKPKDEKPTLAKKATTGRSKRFVVAIDPGHGGKDPGAIGRKGTYEKDVVLQISRYLAKKINQQKDMKAILTRDGDYYVSLRNRMDKARAKGADLFISIHADANPDSSLMGSSVYILSNNSASSEAAHWLAESENSYERKLGGITIEPNQILSSLFLDLAQSVTIRDSLNLAEGVLKQLGSVNSLLRKQVESASFVVLKSPDIPSMLVETAFISNPKEEQRLKASSYQSKLANAMFLGIRHYHQAQYRT